MTHYEVLGVSRDASLSQIRAAFRRLVRAHHPDTSTSGSTESLVPINEAWRVLGDPALRRVYDRSLEAGAHFEPEEVWASTPAATLVPPPFPFKLFVVTAGVFRFSLTRFMIAVTVGRAFRFLLEGYFAVRYGAEAKLVLAKYYPWIAVGLAVFILLVVALRTLFKRGKRSPEPADASGPLAETAIEQTLEAGN